MKVAIIGAQHIPSSWAHSINTVKHSDGFYKCEHEVTLFGVSRFHEKKLSASLDSVHAFYDINENITVQLINDFSPWFFKDLPVLKKLYKRTPCPYALFPDPEYKIACRIENRNYDLVYCRSFRSAQYLIDFGVNVIVETHAPDPRKPDIQRLLRQKRAPNFLGISTISSIIKKRLVKEGFPEEKVCVQEDSVSLDTFDRVSDNQSKHRKALSLPKNKTLITYCGSLRAGKGIDELLAVANAMSDRMDTEFVVVGGPEAKKQEYEKKARQENIENIRFIGNVSQKHIPHYLKASDILIMLYSHKENKPVMDLETTSPIKLFEYMASKRPIVATDLPTISKVLTHNQTGLLASIDDHQAVEKSISSLAENPELREQISERAYQEVQQYSYKKRCQTMVEQLFKTNTK